MLRSNLCKQQALDVDPKAIQQIDFTENLGKQVHIRSCTES